jgi:hypothetical protein
MKIIICLTAAMLAVSTFTFSQSVINYGTGTTVNVQAGASICADSVIISGTFTGAGTICGLLYNLNLTVQIQGFYDSLTNLMVRDTASVYLRNIASPYAIVDSAKAYLSSSGAGIITFANPLNGVNYYIQLKHRNSIETWSKTTQIFSGNSMTFNFTTAKTKAFGDNMIQTDASPVRYAVYSGDVNQNGTVDLNDILSVYNAASVFSTGYVVNDVTGDNLVDLNDILIAYNNSATFVSVVKP